MCEALKKNHIDVVTNQFKFFFSILWKVKKNGKIATSGSNLIDDEGIAGIFEALKENSSLKVLKLSFDLPIFH